AGAALPVAYAVARLPASGVGDWAGFVLGAVALGAGIAAAVLARRNRAVAGSLLAGAGVALLVWAGPRLAVFDNAVLVTDLPAWTDRFGVALGVGAGLAAVVLGIRAVLA